MVHMWLLFSQLFTVVVLITVLLYLMPLPFFDRSSATLMCASREKRIATARAISLALGKPTVELNTLAVERFLYKDGTSVDSLVAPPNFEPLYAVTALKSVVLGFFSRREPAHLAGRIVTSLKRDGYRTQLVSCPDAAFPDGATVLLLSDAFQNADHSGFGLIIRKHAFRIGGQRPARFKGWAQ